MHGRVEAFRVLCSCRKNMPLAESTKVTHRNEFIPVRPISSLHPFHVRHDISAFCVQDFLVSEGKISVHNLTQVTEHRAVNLKQNRIANKMLCEHHCDMKPASSGS